MNQARRKFTIQNEGGAPMGDEVPPDLHEKRPMRNQSIGLERLELFEI